MADLEDEINHVIANFDAWHEPWSFTDIVAQRLSRRSKGSLSLFESIWAEAMAPRNWNATDLAACAETTARSIHAKFPKLSERSMKAIINAAAFNWR